MSWIKQSERSQMLMMEWIAWDAQSSWQDPFRDFWQQLEERARAPIPLPDRMRPALYGVSLAWVNSNGRVLQAGLDLIDDSIIEPYAFIQHEPEVDLWRDRNDLLSAFFNFREERT